MDNPFNSFKEIKNVATDKEKICIGKKSLLKETTPGSEFSCSENDKKVGCRASSMQWETNEGEGR
jgi:hypothetical protein